ncbi:MAG: multiheme c-type cytochrome [Pirellulaceae bacterium]
MKESRSTARTRWMVWPAVIACVMFSIVGWAGAPVGDAPPAASPASPSEAPTAKPDLEPNADLAGKATAAAEMPAKSENEPDPAVLALWEKHVEQWKSVDPREQADNSFCYVCHANYEGEKLTSVHEAEGVGCETCHGMSDKHSQDEDSLVPPDVIFAPAKVASFCGQCHEKRDLLDGDESHEKFFAGQVEPDKTCTSCHDMKHQLKVRTRRWDKETRKIEWYDGVRMMQQQDNDSPK